MSKTTGLILLYIGLAIQGAALYVSTTTAHKGASAITILSVMACMIFIVVKMRKLK